MTSAIVHLRLGVGLMMAWMLSLMSTYVWVRRVPAMTVLLRRRMRSLAGGRTGKLSFSGPADLLTQNNALPGNRKDGFRFGYLRVMIVLTPIYLWLELSFGVSLLEKMSSSVPIEATAGVEHWGRLISGIALALVFLKIWFGQCEKWDRPWSARVFVSLAIIALSVAVMWQIQDSVIEFHVRRAGGQIALALGVLTLSLAIGGFLVHLWLTRALADRRRGVLATLAGLTVLSVLGALLVTKIDRIMDWGSKRAGLTEKMQTAIGVERQRAATLTLIRRGIQLGHYQLDTLPIRPEAIASAEGKTTLALFPIVAAGMDPERFSADREKVLFEVMYEDWLRDNNTQTNAAFDSIEQDVAKVYEGPYQAAVKAYVIDVKSKGKVAAELAWPDRSQALFAGKSISPALSFADFIQQPAVTRHMALELGCLDCNVYYGMPREAYTRELFKWTQAHNVRNTLNDLEDSKHFERGRDGESAARTYWVPIWALLFSMVGAVVHLFKMAFTITEYVQRRAFQAVGAADSRLAQRVVDYSRRLIALGILMLALFIYFFDNRVSEDPNYIRLHDGMWSSHPVVGAIAAHWTINAQALAYPFTHKIKPRWLTFDFDPLQWVSTGAADEDGIEGPVDDGR